MSDLHKTYGSTVAVDDISFEVEEREIFGLVGPNGAGKTTTVECAVGLRQPDRGTVRVLGLDPQAQPYPLRQRIGVQLQEAALPPRLKVGEALDLFASFYDTPANPDRLLEQWGLADKRGTAFASLSGGQRQRLFVALALVNRPEMVFLDEITTGLDPEARHATHDLVRSIREQGTTVVLVTHFMDEVEWLCDRVAVINQGRIAALDTPEALIEAHAGGKQVRFTAPPDFDAQTLRNVDGVTELHQESDRITVCGTGPLLARVATALAEHGLAPDDLRAERPSLEDAFLALTNRNSSSA